MTDKTLTHPTPSGAAWGWGLVPIPPHGTEPNVAHDKGTRRHMVLFAGAISFSGFGMLVQASSGGQPDLVGIAALVTSVGGLVLGTIAAIMAWKKKPDSTTVTLPADMAERLFHERENDGGPQTPPG